MRRRLTYRRAATLVLSLVLITAVLGLVAFAVDLGYILLVRTQLQAAADAAAMAAAAELLEDTDNEIAVARQYAAFHVAGGQPVELRVADVEPGIWDFDGRVFTSDQWPPQNAVRVIARRDDTVSGRHRLFFAKFLGFRGVAVRAEATAAFVTNFKGFRAPSPEKNASVLPLALDGETYDALQNGIGLDEWTWDPSTGQMVPGPDGIPEANLYPEGVDAPGNRGTVDIGTKNSNADVLARQIRDGLTKAELDFHGGSLSLDDNGALELSGQPGISTSIMKELEAIKGKARIVPIFGQVTAVGSIAQYTITGFMGIRVVEVDATGVNKRVMIQTVPTIIEGGILAPATEQKSHRVFSRVCLVR